MMISQGEAVDTLGGATPPVGEETYQEYECRAERREWRLTVTAVAVGVWLGGVMLIATLLSLRAAGI